MADETVLALDGGRPDDFGKLYQFHEIFQKEIEVINRRRARQRDVDLSIDVEVIEQADEIEIDVTAVERRRVATPDAQGDEQRGAFTLQIEAEEDVTGQPVYTPPEAANVIGLALSGGGVRSAAFCLGVLQALNRANVLDKVDYMSTVSGGGYIGCSLTAALESSGERGAPEFPFASKLMEDEPPALQQIRNYSNYLFPDGASDLLHNAAIYGRGLVVNALLIAPALLAASAITLLYYSLRSELWARFSFMNPFGLDHFFLTIDLAFLLIGIAVLWGIVRSLPSQANETEIPGQWTEFVGIFILVFFAVLFCELQPFILDRMLGAETGAGGPVPYWIKTISALLTSVAAAMGYLSNKLGEYVKSAMQSPKWSGLISALVLKAAIVVGGLVLPILIWIVYLVVTYYGLHMGVTGALIFGVAAVLLFLLAMVLQPNANSLHPLYRDRLRKAFLFVPERLLGDADLPVFNKRLSQISGLYGPYHLVNAALNVEDSKTANRRGRNADFFVFSPLFVGSKSTEYAATGDVEMVATAFDFATVMAVSGAAVSSNMGAQNIKPLTATLAILNIRLGYWLRNPQRLAKARPPDSPVGHRMSEFRRRHNFLANYYFVAEIFGLLSEKRKSVYLTDGGHIENLGIYELLRRRCRVIIAVDAEADPQMAFGSFNTLERYALIDLGIRIDLPWQQIANESLVTSRAIDEMGDLSQDKNDDGTQPKDVPKHQGPHCAIGEISYPGDRKGVLVYIKASLTGDENDTVIDYKKRYSAFPHETTLDQLFTEEQFEAYRALGFHAAYGLFDRSDTFAHLDATKIPSVRPAMELLDQLFPRTETAGPPGQKQTFAAWVPAPRQRRQRPAQQ